MNFQFLLTSRNRPTLSTMGRAILGTTLLIALLMVTMSQASSAATTQIITCTTGQLPHGDKTNPPDLVIATGTCVADTAGGSNYYFHRVNILYGGTLQFVDATTDFWAESILVQNGGKLYAGTSGQAITPIIHGTLTIHLWGKDQGGTAKGDGKGGGSGIVCLAADGKGGYQPDPMCGVSSDTWASNQKNPDPCTSSALPGGVNDCFYPYAPIDYDKGDPNGYFGYKVLAVSYGGTVKMFGGKGATYNSPIQGPLPPWNSGTSWVRLAKDAKVGDSQLLVDRTIPVQLGSWRTGDQIVLSTTDYLPGHSEVLTITSVDAGRHLINFSPALKYPHSGTQYNLNDKGVPYYVGPNDDPNLPYGNGKLIETRAAVALLTRSIRIVSGGDTIEDFPEASTGYFFGGHTLVRQGFQAFQMQGVEFYQLGQGGKIMHYPVHFHMARKTPQPTNIGSNTFPVTFVKDCSSWDSMTRWYTIHASQGITLARNVGYASIGHGYYLEDGTETNNQFYANIGIFARSAVANAQNPRQVPGILAGGYQVFTKSDTDPVPYTSDVDHPTVFWITNGWNDFQYNVAAGANSCGVCYWLLPAVNSGGSRTESWQGYASEQKTRKVTKKNKAGEDYSGDDYSYAGTTPLMKFVGNACSTAMTSFLAIGSTTACTGAQPFETDHLNQVPNANIPPTPLPETTLASDADSYYPKIAPEGSRAATKCADEKSDCNPSFNLLVCAAGQEQNCMVTVLDHYTTSFNWAQQNFAAVWLRPQWYLFSNSAITDVQTGGLTMITGGDYTDSSVIPGYWGLASNDVFVGNTQSGNGYASNAGPFNPDSKKLDPSLICEGHGGDGDRCVNDNEGMTMPLSNFAVNQRFYNIYDGPSYQDSNAFLDITKTALTGCTPPLSADCSNGDGGAGWMYGKLAGILKDSTLTKDQCYLPNAAIAWKQPNGFFYPPAFHSHNLFFNNVDIRHFVIDPPFDPTLAQPDYLHPFAVNQTAVTDRYCSSTTDMFSGSWTAIDRQTELSDDDGSLTGLISKQPQDKGAETVISVNEAPFFGAPFQDTECASDLYTEPTNKKAGFGTARSSPYEYVTTVVYPGCKDNCGNGAPDQACGTAAPSLPLWDKTCETQSCYGVPLWRLDLTGTEKKANAKPFLTMMGMGISQRDTLTVNHGTYYIDTTVSEDAQINADAKYCQHTVFQPDQKYYTFLLYAKPTTVQTYKMYIGPDDPEGTIANAVKNGTTVVFSSRINKSRDPFDFADESMWPANWTKDYNGATGILTVTMDLTAANDFAPSCAPTNFCSIQNGQCGCSLQKTDPVYTESIKAQCDKACSNWAGKDVDCPPAGCYGFGVDFSKTKFTNAQHVDPPAQDYACFDSQENYWNQGFGIPSVATGSCTYDTSTLPTPDFCVTSRRR